jgi:molecular chaperone GrpE
MMMSERSGRREPELEELRRSEAEDAAHDLARSASPGDGEEADPSGAMASEGEERTEADLLREEVAALTRELEDLRDRHLRLAAEFDNFRKRTSRERAQETDRAQAELVKDLLESLDDLSRVSQQDARAESAEAILQGVQLVERKLRQTLERSGLRPIDAVGQPFDPELHEALTTVVTTDPEEDGLVAQELGKGYLFRDALLRPALVEVKKYRPEAGDGPDGVDEES